MTASCLTRLREHELNGKATGDAQASLRLVDSGTYPITRMCMSPASGGMAIRQSCIFGELAVPRMMPSVSCAAVGGIRFACLAPVPLSGHPMSAENSTALRKMGKPSVPDRRASLATGQEPTAAGNEHRANGRWIARSITTISIFYHFTDDRGVCKAFRLR